jgi:OOP family OmpA-OmpF porin
MSLTIFNCKSQNLITNGSFENYTNIDCVYGGFWNATMQYPYPHVLDNWQDMQTADYFNSVCPHTSLIPGQYGFEVPTNFFGHAQPKEGNAYVGFVFYAKGGYDKEYIYQQLSQPLQSGKVYCLSFYVNMADRCTYAIKNIGALFLNSLPPNLTNGYEINATPQVENQSNAISDTTNWVQIQGCFTANGGEQYMIIGNFTTNFNTDTLNTGANNLVPGREGTSYYYVDDFTLIDQTTVGLNNLSNNNVFEIYPNPNTGQLKFINLQYSNGDYDVKLLDLFGKEVIDEALKQELDISSLDKGVYTLLLYKNKQLVVTKKVMKD